MKSILLPSLLLIVGLAACSTPRDEAPLESGEAVLRAMKTKYDGSWYRTLTFVQTTIQHRPDGGIDTTTWLEAMELPGKLRIDIGENTSGNVLLFRNDSLYVYNDGSRINARPTFHPLLILGFDVYFLPTEMAVSKLDSLGFDLTKVHESTWQDRDVYVVGADEGDLSPNQFWIDRERLYFVRMIQNVGPNQSISQDVHFNSYEKIGGGWVSPEVLFYADSTLALEERYFNMTANPDLDENLFDPVRWSQAAHWFKR